MLFILPFLIFSAFAKDSVLLQSPELCETKVLEIEQKKIVSSQTLRPQNCGMYEDRGHSPFLDTETGTYYSLYSVTEKIGRDSRDSSHKHYDLKVYDLKQGRTETMLPGKDSGAIRPELTVNGDPVISQTRILTSAVRELK